MPTNDWWSSLAWEKFSSNHSGSLYLGLYPKYIRRNLAGLARLRGSDQWKHWHDILWMYEALADADKALARFNAAPTRVPVSSAPTSPIT